jgi:hypothetical protein
VDSETWACRSVGGLNALATEPLISELQRARTINTAATTWHPIADPAAHRQAEQCVRLASRWASSFALAYAFADRAPGIACQIPVVFSNLSRCTAERFSQARNSLSMSPQLSGPYGLPIHVAASAATSGVSWTRPGEH